MKKVLIAILCFICITATAQETVRYNLSFKGIPLGINIGEFSSELIKKNVKYIERKAHIGYYMNNYIGSFAGYDDCIITIGYTIDDGTVFYATVWLPKKYRWDDLKDDYIYMKGLYLEKYNEPSESEERFIYPYYEGEGDEMDAVANENVRYSTFWLWEDSNIHIEISSISRIMVSYCITSYAQLMVSKYKQQNLDDI